MNYTKKIGIFISHIFGEYQTDLCQGIIDAAAEYGYSVETFSSSDGENLGNYSLGEKSILRIPNYREFSGVVFASGTYLSSNLRDQIANTLRESCDCAVIDVNQTYSFFPFLVLDNDTPTGQIVEHLINLHHYKRICYLGCSLENMFSERRESAYRLALTAHNYLIEDANVYICDYEEASIKQALEYFLQGDRKPDAIVCYNDRMALMLLMALYRRGLHVPEDIAITGSDKLEFGQNINPPLTSVSFPLYEMGKAAVNQLLRPLESMQSKNVLTVTADPHIGGSCGCSHTRKDPSVFYQYELSNRIRIMEKDMIDDMNMSASLQGITDIDEGMDLLENYLSLIDNCQEFYLCLYSNWDSVSSHIREITQSEEEEPLDDNSILLKFAMRDGKRLSECSFTKHSALPDYLYAKENSAYSFSPLFFGDREFGYIAISYKQNQLSFHFNFLRWLMHVSSMLKNICDTKHMSMLVNRLEDNYMKDSLTGLLHMRGFLRQSEPFIERAAAGGYTFLGVAFDLDGLKMINDNFGHLEGDFAIQVLGHALESSIRSDDLCGRLGDDEFYVLGANYTEEEAASLTNSVAQYLNNYNRLHTKEYNVSVSSGFSFAKAGADFVLQDLLDHADKAMHRQKKTKDKDIVK